eukprot:1017684-Pelagomonas_calceolata.AAC.10
MPQRGGCSAATVHCGAHVKSDLQHEGCPMRMLQGWVICGFGRPYTNNTRTLRMYAITARSQHHLDLYMRVMCMPFLGGRDLAGRDPLGGCSRNPSSPEGIYNDVDIIIMSIRVS